MSARDKLRNYLIASVIAIAFVAVVLFTRDFFTVGQPQQVMRDLSDAFFLSGIFVACAGGLVWAAGLGTFDMFGYGIGLALDMAFSFKKNWKKKEDFYEYRLRKDKQRAEYKHLLVVGGIMILISLYALLLHKLMF